MISLLSSVSAFSIGMDHHRSFGKLLSSRAGASWNRQSSISSRSPLHAKRSRAGEPGGALPMSGSAVRRYELLVPPAWTPKWGSTNCATFCPSWEPTSMSIRVCCPA